MSPLSLRARLVLGAVLWSSGLFIVGGVALTAAMVHHPHVPAAFHALLSPALTPSLVAIACLAAGVWHVRRALSALDGLRSNLLDLREGRSRRIDGGYPAEVQPLVDDLNALLEHQSKAVARAQAQAGDLAHGLKTPLAIIVRDAEQLASSGQVELAHSIDQQVERMRRQVQYHLARARAAASGGTPGANCLVADSAQGLARTMQRLHSEKRLVIDVHAAPDLRVRVQREDLDEMLGNLLDNACKWARSRVALEAVAHDGTATIAIDDDGAGIEEAMRESVLQRGVRADEAAPGSGFGLAIVGDLAALYGGTIALGRAPLGGVRATLRLPSI
ncbi:MAG TPA: sensor histidine kinase [Vicinamibacterales bacterium]|jgi:signal transduction histidine kinase